MKEEQGGESRQVKDINCFKTLELLQKSFEYLWSADYLSPQMKAESRQCAIDLGLIPAIQVQGPGQAQGQKPETSKASNLGIG